MHRSDHEHANVQIIPFIPVIAYCCNAITFGKSHLAQGMGNLVGIFEIFGGTYFNPSSVYLGGKGICFGVAAECNLRDIKNSKLFCLHTSTFVS
jgi:hypothetical protein